MNKYKPALLPLLFLPAFALLAACGIEPVDPEGFTGRVGGCASFNVYRFNPEMTTAAVVSADASQLILDRTPRAFSLPHSGLDVRIETFRSPAYTYYCDDVGGDEEPIRRLSAVSGTVVITMGDTLSVRPWFTTHNVFVSMRDVTLRDAFGIEVIVPELDFGEVLVGWLPG